MAIVLTLLTVAVLLIISELWWRHDSTTSELHRKFVHITVGSFVAVWPFFLSWRQIIWMSAAFFVVVLASKYLQIFKSIHDVHRATWGELFFALAVGLTALITHHKGVYAVALLQMSLADGLAAIVGVRLGTNNKYHVLGSLKSVAGTVTFFVVSLLLLISYAHCAQVHIPLLYELALAAAASAVENLGAFGLDNLLVPLLVAVALSR